MIVSDLSPHFDPNLGPISPCMIPGEVGEKLKPCAEKVSGLAHDAVEAAKPLAEKASHAVHDAVDKVSMFERPP